MMTLYALKQSRAYRIAWLLELLELDYRVEVFERDTATVRHITNPAAIFRRHHGIKGCLKISET